MAAAAVAVSAAAAVAVGRNGWESEYRVLDNDYFVEVVAWENEMSWEADVVLAWDKYEELSGENGQPLIEAIHALMKAELEEDRFSEFHPMPEEFSNGRLGGENVYFGVFNYFAPDEMLAILRTFDWQKPKNVQLFVRDRADEFFSVFTLNDFKPIEKPLLSLVQPNETIKPFAGQLFAFDGTLTVVARSVERSHRARRRPRHIRR